MTFVYRVIAGIVPATLTDAVLRRLWLEIVTHGITPAEIDEWSRTTWLPWLRWEPEIEALQAFVASIVRPADGDRWADPQLLLRLPDWPSMTWTMTPHVDALPEWAGPLGLRYRTIVAVPLTRSHVDDGCVHVFRDGLPEPVELDRGDLLLMDPDTPHSGGLNRSANVRAVVYLRMLTAQ